MRRTTVLWGRLYFPSSKPSYLRWIRSMRERGPMFNFRYPQLYWRDEGNLETEGVEGQAGHNAHDSPLLVPFAVHCAWMIAFENLFFQKKEHVHGIHALLLIRVLFVTAGLCGLFFVHLIPFPSQEHWPCSFV
jgi:hypothetical protein